MFHAGGLLPLFRTFAHVLMFIGRDYNHTKAMQEILKNDIKAIDVFLLVFSGAKTRFDQSTIEVLKWYEAIFGPEMWTNVIVETTFWSHSEDDANQRMRKQQMDEEVRTKVKEQGLKGTFRNLKMTFVSLFFLQGLAKKSRV